MFKPSSSEQLTIHGHLILVLAYDNKSIIGNSFVLKRFLKILQNIPEGFFDEGD